MRRSESIKELATALSKAQGMIRNAEKDRTNDHFGQGYATLAAVREAIREPLSSNGLSVVQTPQTTERGDLKLTTLLVHTSGEWLEDDLIMTPADRKPQTFGSCITYACRYALMPMIGVAPGDDDDGNEASKNARNANRNRNDDGHHDQRPPNEQRRAAPPVNNRKVTPAVTPKGEAAAPPPADAPAAEQPKVEKPVDPRTEALGQLVDPVKWPKGSVAEYTKLRYGTAKVSELKEDQFAQLVATIKLMTASQAKADAKAFLAAQADEQAKANEWAKGVEAPAV